MDRRSLLDRDDEPPTEQPANVFGDENEIEDFDFAVADGFRPSVASETRPELTYTAPDDDHSHPPIRSISAHYASDPVLSPVVPRNSMRKSRGVQNPFASPEDGEPSSEVESGLQFEPDVDVRRSISSASSAMFARTHSPRFGESTPSHPYDMYPQGTLPRSSSQATSSTAHQPTRTSSTRGMPQHPYAMYPQGVEEDHDTGDSEDDLIQQNPVPVGFAGLGNTYRRRMGPDGEEQDIIGRDGHTEQLPPYTRYPEDGPEKMPLLPGPLHSRAPVHGTDPGMPLMHTALQPTQTQQSMTDESNLERPQSMSNLALISSRESQSSGGFSEKKSWSEKSWKERRKGRICGIPFTWLCIAAALFLFLCAVLGGGLGGYAAGKSSNQNSNNSNSNSNNTPSVVTVVSFYDASPIATPTSGAPPTGTFALTLSTPQEVQADCLVDKSQAAAWDCDLMPNAALALNVTIQNGSLGAELFYASDNDYFYYGAQTPSMATQFAQFLAVQDNDNTSFGPAFYFQETYNKVVVVPENAFDPTTRRFKRDASVNNNNKTPITPGEKPWFCVWNNTFVEAFIYINQKPAPNSATSNTTSGTPSSTWTTSSVTTTTTSTATAYRQGGFGPQSVGDPNSHTDSIHKPQPSGNGNGSNERKRQTQQDPWSSFQQYPNVIKLEERRAPNSSQTAPPYCQQYQILWNFQANILNDYRLWLDESDPGWVAYQSAGIAGQTRRGEPTISGACHCQWMSGQGS